jgi:hypothetical protein
MFDNVVRLIARPQKPANPCEPFTPDDSTARYPILPKITRIESQTARREIAENRHSSLYELRDFDISPYFMMVKPTLARGFNHKDVHWAVLPRVHTAEDRARQRWQTRQPKRAAVVGPHMNRWPANETGAAQYP